MDHSNNDGGSITSLTPLDAGSSETLSFNYDSLDQLVHVTNGTNYTRNYGYDRLGNLTAKTGLGTLVYDSAHPHAVASAGSGSCTFEYDANGNMIERTEPNLMGEGSNVYTQNFDIDNRLTSVVLNNQTASFAYDPDGQRVKKVEPSGETTTYISPYWEKNVTTGEYTCYYLVNGRPVALRQSTGITYLHTDQLGSSAAVTNAGGVVTTNGWQSHNYFGSL